MTFFWAQASLMVFSVLPVFLSEELKVSYTQIGAIEGLAIGASFATKVISGFLTDYYKRRKPFILLGSFFSLLSKPFFALAPGISFVFMARFLTVPAKVCVQLHQMLSLLILAMKAIWLLAILISDKLIALLELFLVLSVPCFYFTSMKVGFVLSFGLQQSQTF